MTSRPLIPPGPGWHPLEDATNSESADADFKPLTREEAARLRANEPPVSVWAVVAAQAAVGIGAALIGWFAIGRSEVAWSMLYGAATVVLPGVLMARGIASPLSRMSLGASAVSFMLWESVKIGVSVILLLLAPRLVRPLSWPALLAAMAVCMSVYWFALLWRRTKR